MKTEINSAVETLIAEARKAFPDTHSSLLRFSVTADGRQLQIMAPGLQWHSIDIEIEHKANAAHD